MEAEEPGERDDKKKSLFSSARTGKSFDSLTFAPEFSELSRALISIRQMPPSQGPDPVCHLRHYGKSNSNYNAFHESHFKNDAAKFYCSHVILPGQS